MNRLRVLALRFGSERHGVNRYGRDLAGAVRALDGTEVIEVTGLDPAALDRVAGQVAHTRPHVVHVHVTDQLFGLDAERAATNLGRLLAAVEVPIVTTLHDVPTPDGALDRRRRAAYDVALAASARVIVSSHHERARLGPLDATVDVVPLLVRPLPRPAAADADRRDEVAVLGYLYPGKGHEHVVAACSRLANGGAPPPVVAVGTAAPRHPELSEQLVALGQRVGVTVTVTGWVPDRDLPGRLARPACPVVPNHGVSASASLTTWVGAGRRPLVASGPFATEFATWAPGCVHLYEPDADPDVLAAAIRRALADPGSTWAQQPPSALAPDRIAATHRSLFCEVAR